MTPPIFTSALSFSLTDTLSALRLPASAATAAAAHSAPSNLFDAPAAPRSSPFDTPPSLPPPPHPAPLFSAPSLPPFKYVPPDFTPDPASFITPPNGPNPSATNPATMPNAPSTPTNLHPALLSPHHQHHGQPHRASSDDLVHSTTFASHLRASFRRAPADRTGELVRLLHDISVVTQCISAYVAHDSAFTSTMIEASPSPLSSAPAPSSSSSPSPSSSSTASTSKAPTHRRRLDPAIATRHMYKALSHDGYACAILESHTELPLTFPSHALHGGYVVALCALDITGGHLPRARKEANAGKGKELPQLDDGDDVECGTWFTVFRRKSSPSVPGRLEDVQQRSGDQVAAGYVLYSSSTRLVYTLRYGGAFSFNQHPVTSQYFMHPTHPLRIPEPSNDEEGGGDRDNTLQMWMDRSQALRLGDGDDTDGAQVLRAAMKVAKEGKARVCNSGCFVADFDAAMRHGGVIVALGRHLLCVAAAAAAMVEEMGGKATNGEGVRILDMRVDDDQIHKTTCLVAGLPSLVDLIEKAVADGQ